MYAYMYTNGNFTNIYRCVMQFSAKIKAYDLAEITFTPDNV